MDTYHMFSVHVSDLASETTPVSSGYQDQGSLPYYKSKLGYMSGSIDSKFPKVGMHSIFEHLRPEICTY